MRGIAEWCPWLALASLMACSGESLSPIQPSPGLPAAITFSGVITDSETNAPLAEATICAALSICVLTAGDGSYRFAVDPAALHSSIGPPTDLCPFAFLDGYEQRGACRRMVNNQVSWSTTLQRQITLNAGQSVRSTVFRGEGNGVVDSGLCESCKSFNVLVPGSGTLFLSVVPNAPSTNLQIQVFYEGFENGALEITTQRSVQVVVHASMVPASFELFTSFTRGS
jgi:hypothetical protein